MACQGKALMLNDLHPLTSFKRNSISKSSVKFVGNARRTFVLSPSSPSRSRMM